MSLLMYTEVNKVHMNCCHTGLSNANSDTLRCLSAAHVVPEAGLYTVYTARFL
jgi:hypothetical protein